MPLALMNFRHYHLINLTQKSNIQANLLQEEVLKKKIYLLTYRQHRQLNSKDGYQYGISILTMRKI